MHVHLVKVVAVVAQKSKKKIAVLVSGKYRSHFCTLELLSAKQRK